MESRSQPDQPETDKTVYLKDYQPPNFWISHTELEIHLEFQNTRVIAIHQVIRKTEGENDFVLDTEFTTIHSVYLNDCELDKNQFREKDNKLVIEKPPAEFTLKIENTLDPSRNTELSGLYKSGDMLCTQCEAEGYRRITPAQDRPDSLGTYTVKLIGNKEIFPVLLCNGNKLEEGAIDDVRHYSVWHDPFPKPTYLFAIVAGQLSCLEDTFTTMSGKLVDLRFYSRPRDINKCHHAMDCLKNSMKWDEQVYGREYDLDLFNVVAVEDFNMGAMENKSLNIFNTKYVLADTNIATDSDFLDVEAVIGHEYFHNWSGNRVTCRDWFQLSLKEGFTVFRDQEFSSDMGSRGVKRIDDVNILRNHQFREDASPMAHSVRPDSYQEINNFYTVTVYNKGAEVVRMLHTIVGGEVFRKGTDHYFDEFDGQAVTTDDFVAAMEKASGMDFGQFKNWYSQAGTPEVTMVEEYDQAEQIYRLTFNQHCPATPGQPKKDPFVIPIATALIDNEGNKLALSDNMDETTLVLDQSTQTFEFKNISSKPIPSVLRRFSAPVKMNLGESINDLEFLLNHDDDPFNRWEAGQKLFLSHLLDSIACLECGKDIPDASNLTAAVHQILMSETDDGALDAFLISLPAVSYISEQLDIINPESVRNARLALKQTIARELKQTLLDQYLRLQSANSGSMNHQEMGDRSLRDVCLGYLCSLDDVDARTLCTKQLTEAKCMTDSASAIANIANSDREDRHEILDNFYSQWQSEPLVLDKWLRVQATADRDDTLQIVEKLTHHPAFDYKNPNKVYSLILGFTHGNPYAFHSVDGSGYQFLEKWVQKLDPVNPQVAARLISALNSWRKYTPQLAEQMQQTLSGIRENPELSGDVREIVEKNLTTS